MVPPWRALCALLSVLSAPALLAAACADGPGPSPAASGTAPASVDELLAEASRIRGLRSLLVSRDGRLVVEGYFGGAGPEDLQHLRSATKSVTSLLVGIAIDQGLLASVDQTLGEILGEKVAGFGADKAALTLEQLLTMRAGLEWNEMGGVTEYNRFRVARDPLAHYLERPFVAAPGERWSYSSGASHLLSVVLSEVTGETALAWARRVLFAPLDIREARWETHHDGRSNGAAGLELRPRDSLKLGELLLGRGSWRGRRIVSPEWIEASTRSHVEINEETHYGYQWWINPERPILAWSAMGFAGQGISAAPQENAALGIHCQWRGLARPVAEQTREVSGFVNHRLVPFLLAAESPVDGGLSRPGADPRGT